MKHKTLLSEGGLGGHMPHLYENPFLTFKNLKDVLTKASEGQLEGTEKTDGQNLYISYSVKDGKAKAARNLGNISTGGMTAIELAKKFGGRGTLEAAFTEAFNSFEKAIGALTDEEKLEIFGKDADIFYNAEIQDPRNANVINYDFKTLNIHRVGHAKFDKETGKIVNIDTAENAAKLENALEKMKNHLEHDDFRIQMNAIRRLEALSTDDALSSALSSLESVISSAGISDDQTIGDYLTVKIVPMIKADFPSVSEDRMEMLMNRLFHGTDIKVKEIQAGLDKEQKSAISAAVKKLGDYFKEVIAPIENIIHDFAVEILKAFHSKFVLDNDKEVKRLQGEVAAAIKGIEASGREDAMEILTIQLAKLKKAENVSTAAEGFVFDYDGKTYKFTGNFAPANQLLGLFKYGRGKIPALSKLNEEVEGKKLLVLLPGGYKPPTKGHYEMIRYYSDQPDVEKVLVLIGPGERNGIGRDVSMEVFDLYGVNDFDKVSVEPTEYNSPIQAAYEFLISDSRREDYKDLAFSMGASDKADSKGQLDFERAEKFVEYFRNNPDKLPEGFEVGEPPCCPAIGGDVPISATNLRKAIANKDVKIVKILIPDHIDPEQLINIASGLEEMASMAGGSVAGHSGGAFKKDEEEEELKYEQISRRQFIMESVNEKKLRKIIRKMILVSEESEKSEKRLRSIVHNLLLEQGEEEKPGSSYTGINELGDLLKQIMPKVEIQYKKMKTDLKQRSSFRKHLINNIKNLLKVPIAISDITVEYERIKGEKGFAGAIAEALEVDFDDKDEPLFDLKGEEEGSKVAAEMEKEKKKESGVEVIPGEDPTGAEYADVSINEIDTQILNSFNRVKSNRLDRELFVRYLLINALLNMDNYESELSVAPEPEVPGYEEEKAEIEAGVGTEETPPAAAEIPPAAEETPLAL